MSLEFSEGVKWRRRVDKRVKEILWEFSTRSLNVHSMLTVMQEEVESRSHEFEFSTMRLEEEARDHVYEQFAIGEVKCAQYCEDRSRLLDDAVASMLEAQSKEYATCAFNQWASVAACLQAVNLCRMNQFAGWCHAVDGASGEECRFRDDLEFQEVKGFSKFRSLKSAFFLLLE